MKKAIVVLSLFLGVILLIFGFNFITLQAKMNEILKNNNKDEKVLVHYDYFVNPKVVVYDLNQVSDEDSKATVFGTFLKFADKEKTKKFDTVKLAYKGKNKFKIKGDYFKKLGDEYSYQSPVYTVSHFAENVFKMDGQNAYETWEGGILGVMLQQMNDFNDLNDKWYMNDLTKK